MSNLFQTFPTVAEVKSEYRRLAMLHHPDRGGDCEMMKRVNADYFVRLESLDGQKSTKGFNGQEHTYRYQPEAEHEAAALVQHLLGLDLPGCEILLIGTWVWVEGDTRPVRAALKDAGLRWHSKREMWYWSPEKKRRHYSKMSTDEMKAAYGVRYYEREEERARPSLSGWVACLMDLTLRERKGSRSNPI